MPTVKEIMKPELSIDVHKTVLEAAKLMKTTNRGSLTVVDGKITVGIITERDFLTRIVAENLPHDTPVIRVMSSPLVTIDADTPIKDAARIMCERKIRRLPVVEGGALVGIIVSADVLRQLSQKSRTEEIWEALTEKHQ